jgi:hypothetical protein
MTSAFIWISAALTGLFTLSLLILLPRQGESVAA